ncbi:hypothetical protein YC2023_098831 [Brassica napus]
MVSQIVWLGVKDVFTQIAKVVIRLKMTDSRRKRFSALGFSYTTNVSYNHPVVEVILVLLKSGQSPSREKDVEEMKDCRSMKQYWCRSTERKEELLQSPPETPLKDESCSRNLVNIVQTWSLNLARWIVDRQLGSCIDRRSERCIDRQLVDSVDRHFLKINMQELRS